MNRWLLSAATGFLSTIPMTMVMLKLKHDYLPSYEKYPLPPRLVTRNFLSTLALRNKMTYQQLLAFSTLAHFSFGTFAGSLFYPLVGASRYRPLLGVGYALIVWTLSYTRFGFIPNLGLYPPASVSPRKRNALMIVAHIVWGASLGSMISLSEKDSFLLN